MRLSRPQIYALAAGAVALAAPSSAARAQALATTPSAQCQGADVAVADACQKATDLFSYLSPQLGLAIAGGNATLGQGGALGGVLKVSLGVRANGFYGSIPRVGDLTPGTDGAVQSTYQVERQPVGFPVADVAVSVFPGLDLGGVRILGADAIASAAYVPEIDEGELSVRTAGSSLRLGWGGRVGLIGESALLPAVSVSYLVRELPRLTMIGAMSSAGGDDTLALRRFDVKTTAWRVTASKRVLLFTLVGGYGRDSYEASADVHAVVREGVVCALGCTGEFALASEVARDNFFGDVMLNVGPVKLVGEYGVVRGGSASTYNRFENEDGEEQRATVTRHYAALGLRVGF